MSLEGIVNSCGTFSVSCVVCECRSHRCKGSISALKGNKDVKTVFGLEGLLKGKGNFSRARWGSKGTAQDGQENNGNLHVDAGIKN
jgi:hypothetical protein